MEIPILCHLGVLGGKFKGIWLLPVQNLMSDSCSAISSSYKGEEILCLSRLIIEIPIFGPFGGLGGELGASGYFRCKI